MTQFYRKYTNVNRADFSMCRARLEVVLRAPLIFVCKNCLGGH